jgi:putative aminopeptidase FrvX
MEEEVDALIRQELNTLGLTPEQDRNGNIFVKIAGRQTAMPPILISAHKDEVSTIVRDIDAEGRIWMEPLGGCYPAKYGEGPFDIVVRNGVIEGVLCVGSAHSSALSTRIQKTKTAPLTWDMVYVDCRRTREELRRLGVAVGARGVIGRRRKTPFLLPNDTICGYALDDKGAVAILLQLARLLRETPPKCDVILGFTTAEEGGCSGGLHLARTLEAEDFIALEIAPLADEYPVDMSADPVVLFKDSLFHYTPSLCHELLSAAAANGIACQRQVVRSFGSEASASLKAGMVARAACLGFPTLNTHGYEMSPLAAMSNCAAILHTHLTTDTTKEKDPIPSVQPCPGANIPGLNFSAMTGSA